MSSTADPRRGTIGVWQAVSIGVAMLLAVIFLSWAWRTAAAARADILQQRAHEMASESRALCEKWGLAAGTPALTRCLADIQTVRDRHAQRIAEDEEPF
jgi:hypothetical protein